MKEVSTIKQKGGKNKIIIAKINKNTKDLRKCKLRLVATFIQNKQLRTATIDLQYDILHELTDNFIFKTMIKPIDIKEIKEGLIVCE